MRARTAAGPVSVGTGSHSTMYGQVRACVRAWRAGSGVNSRTGSASLCAYRVEWV